MVEKNSSPDFAADMTQKVSDENRVRIDKIKSDAWIGYDRAIYIRNQIQELLHHPRTHRMPNLSLIGDSNNGKSMLLKNFCKNNNPPEDPNEEKTILTVLMIQTPPSADEGRLYYAILDRLCAPGSPREPEDSKLRRICIILRHLETKMLILDDFFNVASSSPAKRRKFLNALRNLSIALEMPIVISGTEETLNILSVDPSIANRFKPLFLPKWNNESRLKEFARFVVSVEKTLGLKNPSTLLEERVLLNLLTFSEGLIGETVAILRLFAEWAVRSGVEAIDGRLINRNNLLELGWVMPSDRARHRE